MLRKEKHTWDMQENVHFLRPSIVEDTDLREEGDVRGSALIVTMTCVGWSVVCLLVGVHTSHVSIE